MSNSTAPFSSKLVLIAGGTCSGKTTLAKQLHQAAPELIALVPNDNYYKSFDPAVDGDLLDYNWDHPNAQDNSQLVEDLKTLLSGQPAEIPTYSFPLNSRLPETLTIVPKPVIIVEGVLVLHFPELRELADLKVFVKTPDDIRAMRRIKRNVLEYGRDISYIYDDYLKNVYPMHHEYVKPTQRFADIIIDGRGSTDTARKVLLDTILKEVDVQ